VTARSTAEKSATKPCTPIPGTLRIINTYQVSRQLRMTVRQLFQNSLSRPPTSLICPFDLRAVPACRLRLAIANRTNELYTPLPYAVSGLPWTWLICLEPGSGSSPIHCSLSIACPGGETAPEYEAWSYCCGDQTDRFLITCNGHVIDMKLSANKKMLHDLDLVLQSPLFKDEMTRVVV
jgi:hypothetical protein